MQNSAWGKIWTCMLGLGEQERSRPRLLPRLPWEKDLDALIPYVVQTFF